MALPRVGVAIVVQNDAEIIERSLMSYYDHVERIVVSTDPNRGWSGVGITPDHTIELIRSLDRDKKIELVLGDFYRERDPEANETAQRQFTVSRLEELAPNLDWVFQIDSDEEFVDFPAVLERFGELPKLTKFVQWRLLAIYKRLQDGRLLVITDAEGKPSRERFAIAHRPRMRLKRIRTPHLPPKPFRDLLPYVYRAPADLPLRLCVLHWSWTRSEARLREKLETWGHAHQVDAASLVEQWRRAETDWAEMKDFHPINPHIWPALRAMAWEELV